MGKSIILILALNMALYSCQTKDRKEGISSNRNESSTSQVQSVANSNNPVQSSNSNESLQREASVNELRNAAPPDILQQEACSIEENVTFTPETGGQAPLTVTFDAKQSKAPCGKIVKWIWDFGDGTKAKGAKVKHTYTAPGTYIATLRMTDNKGNINLVQLDYVVLVTP